MSQKSAAEAADVSSRAISDYETGKVSPQLRVFERLLEAYGITTLQQLAALAAPRGDEVREAAVEQLQKISPGKSADYYRGLADAYTLIAETVDGEKHKGE